MALYDGDIEIGDIEGDYYIGGGGRLPMVAVKVTEGREESSKEMSRLLEVDVKGTG